MASTKTQIAAAVSAITISLIIGTVAYHYIEGWSFAESFYFSVVTVTTIGYGDLYPTTDFSRLFTAFYILTNVAIVIASLGIIGNYYIQKREGRIEARVISKLHDTGDQIKNRVFGENK